MANQITIDIGAAANDGTGDPLRTAFNYVNNNFSNVWNTGLPNSNVQFSDNKILTVNTNANLVLAPNGIGKVASNVDIVPNTANAFSLGGVTRRWNTVYTQYLDVSNYISGTLGNVTVAVANLHVTGGSNGYVLQTDGAGNLTWTAQTGGSGNGTPGGANTQIQYNNAGSFGGSASFTFNRTSNVLTVLGNISAGNLAVTSVTTTGTVYGNSATFYGDQYSDGALYVGTPAGTVLGSDVVIQITANAGGYSQTNFQNISNAVTASGDYIITADNGNDTTKFIDLGMTSSGWDGSETNVLSGLVANNGYLYVQDGNLSLGVRNGNTSYKWNFDTTGLLTVPGNIIPAGNNTQSLGSATRQWKDLWVSNNTIYINSVPLSVTAGNILTVNGADVVTTDANGQANIGNLDITGTYVSIAAGASETIITISPNIEGQAYLQMPNDATANVANVRLHNDAGNIELSTGAGSYNWYFDNAGNLSVPNNINFNGGSITQVVDEDLYIRASDAEDDGWGLYTEVNDGAGNVLGSTQLQRDLFTIQFAGGSAPQFRFNELGQTEIPGNIRATEYVDTSLYSVSNDGGAGTVELKVISYAGDVLGSNVRVTQSNATISTNNAQYTWNFDNTGNLTIPGSIVGDSTIILDNRATGNSADIQLYSADDILVQGRDKPDDSESEGGDINIYAGDGANAATSGFDTGGGGDIQISGGLGGSDTGGGFGGSGGGTINISSGDGGVGSDTTNAGSGGSLSLSAGDAAGVANTALGGVGGSITITAGDTTRINEIGGTISLNTGSASGDGTSPAGYLEINIPSSNVGPGGTWTFSGTGTSLNVPANSEIYGASAGNFTVGCAGNTIVTSSDYGANVKNWVFGYTGTLSLPGITTATGAEAMTVAGTRTLVGGFDNPNGAYAATFSGSSPVEVYSCDPVTQSAKFTFAIQTNNATFGWEQFDVAVIKLFAGGVGVTVSNRMNNNPDNGNTQVTATLGEGNQIVISLTQPGSGTAYVNYTATEFKLPID